MAWLALVAVLLTVAMPTTSRVLAATIDTGGEPVLVELCSAGGIKLIDVSPLAGEEAPPASPDSMAAACDYCVLTPPVPVVLALLSAPLLHTHAVPVPHPSPAAPKSQRNARGLGAQAPPILP